MSQRLRGATSRYLTNADLGTACLWALSVYSLTSVIVAAGVSFGNDFVRPLVRSETAPSSYVDSLTNWDGYFYAQIAREGYTYHSTRRSNIAFFPAYPLAGWGVTSLTGLREEVALVFVTHFFLIAAFILIAWYVAQRSPDRPSIAAWTLVAMGLWPVSFFFRMAYSEAMFLFLLVLSLYSMEVKWPVLVIALIAGSVTACRPVGVAVVPIYLLYLWQGRKDWKGFIGRLAATLPLACWGILAFMLYQYAAMGDALAFVRTQRHWATNPDASWGAQIASALILEPLWSKYDSTSIAYWAHYEPLANPLFSLEFANPIYFAVAMGLIILGRCKGWLNQREQLLGVLLLMIPYFLQSHRTMMMSQGRFAAAAFPAYLVMGHVFWRLPAPLSTLLLAICGFFLGLYAALFAAHYRLI